MTKPRPDWEIANSLIRENPSLKSPEGQNSGSGLGITSDMLPSCSKDIFQPKLSHANVLSNRPQQSGTVQVFESFSNYPPKESNDMTLNTIDTSALPTIENFETAGRWTDAPSLTDAILETDNFLSAFTIDGSPKESVKMEIETDSSFSPRPVTSPRKAAQTSTFDTTLTPDVNGQQCLDKKSPNDTPTNESPITTPKFGSPGSDLSSVFLNSILENKEEEFPLIEDLFMAMTKQTSKPEGSTVATKQEAPKNFLQNQYQQQTNIKQANNFFGAFTSLANGFSSVSANHHHSKAPSRTSYQNFKNFSTDLEPIPEDDALKGRMSIPPTPLNNVGLQVPKPVTTSYNISFPATNTLTQFGRDNCKYDPWKTPQVNDPQKQLYLYRNMSPGATASPYFYSCSSGSSPASIQSPFHEAPRTSVDLNEFQPLNFIKSDGTTTMAYNYPTKSSSTEKVFNKATKRSRTNTPTREDCNADLAGMLNPMDPDDSEDQADGASLRQRKKSSPSQSDTRRRNSIKDGIDELQRIIPHLGTPESDKVSQASVLSEAAKFIRKLQDDQRTLTEEISRVKESIDDLNKQIEVFQSQLPDTGAPMLPPTAIANRNLPQLFHDHVIDQTLENWRYWVFTAIVGHFVHSFSQEVSSACLADLETTALEWVTNSMSLQQLRKDAYRKLAKLCVKTSIVENPSKLPQEAIDFATHKGKGEKKPTWYSEHPWP